MIFMVAVACVGYKLGESRGKAIAEIEDTQELPDINDPENSPANNEAPEEFQEMPSFYDDVNTIINIRDDEEISQNLRGKVFQSWPFDAAVGENEALYFTPQDKEYYWFCSSMDLQSRIRAEYGVWEVEEGFMATTALKLIEWIGGHFAGAGPYESTGNRFGLVGYDEVLTEVNIESQNSFIMYIDPGDKENLSIEWIGGKYYYRPDVLDIDSLEEYYENYFTLFEK